MKSIIKFFIDNSKFTLLLTFLLTIWGAMGLTGLNRQTFPSVNFATAIINTVYPGASASDIEVKITRPVEDEIKKVSGLKDVTSTSMAGMSTVKVRVDMDNEDVGEVMSDLQKALDRVSDFPQDLQERPVLEELNSDEVSVLEIAVIGSNENRKRDLAAEDLQNTLEDVKGVGGVELTGYQERQFRILLDQRKLDRHHIGIDEVLAKIKSRNVNIPGGHLKSIEGNRLVRLQGEIKNSGDLSQIVLRSNFSGQKVLLKDVAKLLDSEEDQTKKTSVDGRKATLMVIRKSASADTISVSENLFNELELFKARYPDFEFKVYHDEARKVDNKLSVLSSNALSGFLLVVLFLLIFLPGRLGVMASISLPVAVFGTFGFMNLMGANLNSITILALVIALGMLVDNAVVVTENYTRLLKKGMSSSEAAVEAASQIWLPVTATALTTIAAFLPMMVTKGVLGEFIKYIPIVVSISLLLSLAESFFLLPMRVAAVGSGLAHEKHSRDWFDRVQDKFELFMEWSIRHRYAMALICLGILSGSGYLLLKENKFILFPAGETERYIARYELSSGTSVHKTWERSQGLTMQLKEAMGPDLDNIVNKAGDAKIGVMDSKAGRGEHSGLIIMKVTDEAAKSLNPETVLKRLRQIQPKGFSTLTYEAEIMGPPVGSAINMTFRSNHREQLKGMTDKIKEELSTTPGIFNLKFNELDTANEIYGVMDYNVMGRLGVELSKVGNTVRTALQGTVVSDVQLNQKVVDLKVEMNDRFRKNSDDLGQLKVMDQRGNLIPLKSLVTFKERKGEADIKHFDFRESRTMVGDVNPEIITSAQANKILVSLYEKHAKDFPLVSYTVGGEAESTKESMTSLALAMILALMGIFALLVFIFKSYLRPAIIMSTIPLGFVGFAVAFWLHDLPVSFLSLIGMVGLSGIVVNSGIVLISFIDQLREESELSLHEILAKASGMRLRAVLVTSLTTFSGLIPTAYGIGGSDPMLMPLTLAMAWGLASGTLFTLVWVPCGYAILEDFFALLKKLSPFQRKNQASSEQDLASKDNHVSGGITVPVQIES